jgi:hypothetical protein
MEAIESITRTINVFVNFLQSVNCLFLQIGWLENNCRGESSTKFFIVIFILSFCVVYAFMCDMMDKCSDPNSSYIMDILIYTILISVLGYFLFKRYRDQQIQNSNNNNQNDEESVHNELQNNGPSSPSMRAAVSSYPEYERETLMERNYPTAPVAIAEAYPVVDMTNLNLREKRLAAMDKKRYESV